MPPLPVRRGAAVALDEVLARVRAIAAGLGVRVISSPQLERIEVELRGQLVERALEPERALDEAGRAERLRRRQVELRTVGRRLEVRAGVQHQQRSLGHRDPAVGADRVHELAAERRQRAVAARADDIALDRRVAAAGGDVLLAPRQRAADCAARPPRELRGDEGVFARAVLRAEAAAHVLADDAHLVGGQVEGLRLLLGHAPDVLSRGVDLEHVAVPAADRLVRLHRVVQHRLRAVGRLDDDIRLGEPAFEVAALVAARLVDQRAAGDRLVGIEQRFQHLPLDVDQGERLARLAEAVGADRRNRSALVGAVRRELRRVSGADRAAHARRRERGREIQAPGASVRIWRAQHRGVEHAGEVDVGRVARLAACAGEPVVARVRPPDDVARAGGPLLERVLVHDEPDLLAPTFDFLLGADQPRHVRIASSIFG